MKTANMITLARCALIPIFIALWYYCDWQYSFAVFILAGLTDKLDGYVARKYNQVTNFGKFIDPLADKLLICAALFVLTKTGVMHPVATFIVVSRELIITSLRTLAMSEGRVLAAGTSGKVKMVVQIVCVSLLLCPPLAGLNVGWTVGDIAVWFMTAVTVWSGVEYCVKNRDVIGRP